MTMTQADWAALKAANDAGGHDYLTSLAAQKGRQEATGGLTAGNPNGPPTNPVPTTPPSGVTMTTDANGNPITGQDALAILGQELTDWGFGHDAIMWAAQQIQSNNSVDQILYSMRQQDFYKKSIFGQVMAARQSAGLPAMTEAQILSYKDYAIGLAQQAGLPQGFITDNELTTLMGNDVSTSELDQRITQGYQAAIKAPPDVLNELQTYYGISPGNLAAYYLDPKRALPLIQNQFLSAQVGAQATRTGFGQISQQQAMGLAELGVTDSQAKTGFTDLAKQAQLMGPLPGSAELAISEGTQLGAEFGGNAQNQQEIQRRAQQREAVFAGNYHYAETQNKGITGLGSVQRNG